MIEFKQPVDKPEWLDDGLRHAIRCFTLALNGRLPDAIKGWMLTTACMRVLRAIYGSDLNTAAAIRERVLQHELRAVTRETQSSTGQTGEEDHE